MPIFRETHGNFDNFLCKISIYNRKLDVGKKLFRESVDFFLPAERAARSARSFDRVWIVAMIAKKTEPFSRRFFDTLAIATYIPGGPTSGRLPRLPETVAGNELNDGIDTVQMCRFGPRIAMRCFRVIERRQDCDAWK